MPHADLGDVELFYTDEGEGSGPPLLFVHGYSCDSHDWMWQLAHFGRTRRVIAVDLRGHGRSSAPEAGYEPTQFAADLVALLDELGTGPVVAIGHSLGGTIVSTLAVEHPDRVHAVVAIDAGYLVPDEFEEAVAQMYAVIKQDPVAGAKAMLSGVYTAASPPALRTWHQRRIEGVPPHVLVGALIGLQPEVSIAFRRNTVPFLAQRRCPVLSLWADEDRPVIEAPTFADPRSRALSFPGSGHWLHQERPAEVNVVIEAWLQTL